MPRISILYCVTCLFGMFICTLGDIHGGYVFVLQLVVFSTLLVVVFVLMIVPDGYEPSVLEFAVALVLVVTSVCVSIVFLL